ncbi:MAG: 16S rRNA (cytidine(1402)-2'-O)-methyltransferase [Actinobacteria bacterium]|nr:MAG: 16S rRNA (cytidine(1402)-2'-O)-methyltransferase [Actinomycetota bacterium]
MTPAQGGVGRLVVCPTPIGNLEDVTLRVLKALSEADVVACEDTRRTRKLLERHGLRASLLSLHEHNERERARALVARLHAGERVALVSDSGTPLVSDPGFSLMRQCLEQGLAVEVLPGPSAVITGLVASGLPLRRWSFAGFLPRRRAELERLFDGAADTLVAFESPRRLAQSLAVLAKRDPARAVAVCRELSKLHEEVRRGSAAELAEHYRDQPARGEIVLVVGPPAASAGAAAGVKREEALAALRALVQAGARARPAAAALAKLAGVNANDLYRGLTNEGQ